MAYKHILIAVDLSPESKVLVEKAVSMAHPTMRKFLIHVDVNYSDLYTGLIDVNLGDMQKRVPTHHALTEPLSTNAGYPITETLSGSGDLARFWSMQSRNTIWIWWFVVTTRLWSKLMYSTVS